MGQAMPEGGLDEIRRRRAEQGPPIFAVPAADGGRIGYSEGTTFEKWLQGKQKFDVEQTREQLYRQYLEDMRRQKVAEQKQMAAQGGRIGYAGGTNNILDKITSLFIDEKGNYREALQKAKYVLSEFISGKGTDLDTGAEWYNKLPLNIQKEIISEKIKMRENPSEILKTIIPEEVEMPVYDEELAGKYGFGSRYNEGGRVGKLGGGVMGIGTPGMRLPGIPQMAPDGLEYNMKAGGFQNLGAQEGKDDVNAKLAKNEFVMTADAVRGAGGGNIEVGAQRMYDTMKQLEGKVA
jgi:hypothetical protein